MSLDKLDSKKTFVYVLITVLMFQFLILLYPIFSSGISALGYDTGFYRRYLLNHDKNILREAVPGLDHTVIAPRILLGLINQLGFSEDVVLLGSYLILVLICSTAFCSLIANIYGRKTAIFCGIPIAISAVVYHAYWFMFYKNFVALALLFILLNLITRDKYPVLRIALAVLIVISHQTTTFFLFVFLALYIALEYTFKKRIKNIELCALTLSVLTYFYFHPNIQAKIDAPPVGIFLTHSKFILLNAGFLLLSLFGIKEYWTALKKHTALAAYISVSFLFPIFSLPYYQRIYLYTFFSVAVIASIGMRSVISKIDGKSLKIKILYYSLVIVCVAYQIGALWYIVRDDKPLITPIERENLALIIKSVPQGASIITSARLVPWVQGWSQARVYGPGLLKDKNSPEEWYAYWAGDQSQKLTFLSQYPKPLYFFIGEDQQSEYLPIKCVEKITLILYKLNNCLVKDGS